MREVPCRLQDLPNLHPRLLWETIGLAAAAVLRALLANHRILLLSMRRIFLASAAVT